STRAQRGGPQALEFRRAIGSCQGDIPARRARGAHSPTGVQAGCRHFDGSALVTKLLYVEDNDDNVYMLKMRLELLQRVADLVAPDGEEGCAIAGAERPDLILIDLEMPGVDGWEATRRLKANPQTRSIPVIALSAHVLAGTRERALAAGCDEFDTKPIDFDRLVTTIGRLLKAGQE